LNNNLHFVCSNDDNESIPEKIREKLELTFEKVHCDGYKMALLAKSMMVHNEDIICRVPFSNTVEAESLGAGVKFSDENVQARIGKYRINDIKDVYGLKEMDFESKSIWSTINAVGHLKGMGETVCIQVEGPFTIASQLMDSTLFYKSLLKEKEAIGHLFEIIQEGIMKYVGLAEASGARVISYADPAGTIDIVGPAIYKKFSGPINSAILRRIRDRLGNAVVHICGRTSSSLETGGFAEKNPIKFKAGKGYSEGIIEVLTIHPEIKLLGNGCIKRGPVITGENIMWAIEIE
jgi:uroporphyrinogen-III decarboxylase